MRTLLIEKKAEFLYSEFPVIDIDDSFYLRRPDPLKKEDRDSMYTIYNDPKITQFVPDDCIPKGINGAQQEVQHYYNIYNSRAGIYWFIARKSDNVAIGTCGFYTWDRYHNKLEMAYNIMSQYHNKGIMTKVIGKAIEFAFTKLCVVRIECQLEAINYASIKVLEKNHFQKDGILPKYRFYKNNKHLDVLICSITDDVFFAKQNIESNTTQ